MENKANAQIQTMVHTPDQVVYQYDALVNGPVVLASSFADIVVSRNSKFQGFYVTGKTDESGKFRITNPPAGMIYWKIKDQNVVHAIRVDPPLSTELKVKIPEKIQLNENFVWSANDKASFYRIEVSDDPAFENKVRTFSTKKNSLPVKFLGQGDWFVRIGALNLASGSFEYSQASKVQVK